MKKELLNLFLLYLLYVFFFFFFFFINKEKINLLYDIKISLIFKKKKIYILNNIITFS